jgi:Raf kinase inhibitor-like YbhB/YbcL family protein
MKLTSAAFAEGESIPKKYARRGEDQSPPLSWTEVPAGTKSLALVVDDPDAPDPAAPRCCWVHWVAYNLPANIHGLPEGASGSNMLGGKEGLNDWKHEKYEGPQPPRGRHRYFQ